MQRLPFLSLRFVFQISVLILSFKALGQNSPIVHSALIFPLQEKHVHGSTLVALPNGDMLAAWFEGSGERTANDVKIMGARLQKGEMIWSEPFLMADTPNLPDCNPVMFLNQKGKLFMIWTAVQANRWEHSILRFRTSENYFEVGAPIWNWQDNILLNPGDEFANEVATKMKELPSHGMGWSEYAPKYDNMIIDAAKDPRKRTTGWMTRIKPLHLENGKIILPLYSDGFNFSLMAISEDEGESWKPSLPLVGRGPIQPALVKKKNGNLVAYLRDSGDAPSRVHVSESSDQGQSWSASAKKDIPNTASVEMLNLSDGRWAFLGNDIEDGRYRLSLFLSDDEGKTWNWKIRLEDHSPAEGGYSYPSLIQSQDGKLHITYSAHPKSDSKSINYLILDPSKVPLVE